MSRHLPITVILFIFLSFEYALSQESEIKFADLRSNLFYTSDPTPLKDSNYSNFKHSLITSFSDNRIAVIKSAHNIGSAVLLGFSDDKKQAFFATNYHVVGNTDTVLVSFALMSRLHFPSSKIACMNIYDICIVSIETARMESLSVFQEILNLSKLKMIPSAQLNVGDKIAYVSNMNRHSIYSVGEISQRYSNKTDFNDDSFLMMSTNAYFRTGMSGGAVINETGDLIGLVSFYTILETETGKPSSNSYFLPTEWVEKALQRFEGNLPDFVNTVDLPLWAAENPQMPSYLKEIMKKMEK